MNTRHKNFTNLALILAMLFGARTVFAEGVAWYAEFSVTIRGSGHLRQLQTIFNAVLILMGKTKWQVLLFLI